MISIDKGGGEAVIKLANDFEWKHGKKEVILQKENLGLRKHIVKSGDLTAQYGSIIMLEDDLYVSPYFYQFAVSAIDCYEKDQNLAGIALYNYEIEESSFGNFHPIEDDSSVYFLQLPCSWGQVWTKQQWSGFKNWLEQTDIEKAIKKIPNYIQLGWSERSWKKWFVAYMMEQQKYFVYPRISLSTNFGDAGANFKGSNIYQTSLQIYPSEYRFQNLENSKAIYDAWFELEAELLKQAVPKLANYDFTIDLIGAKTSEEINAPYVLTTQKCQTTEWTYATALKPLILNVFENQKGEGISFCKKESIQSSKRVQLHNRLRKYYYTLPKMRNKLLLALEKLIHKFF